VQRHNLLEARQLTAQMFDAVRDLLGDRDLLVTTGTIIDATWIAAPSSTKNATRTRDPEVRQTRKGTSWYFGMKGHIGTDLQIGCPTGLTDGPPPASLPHGDHRFPRPSRRANASAGSRHTRQSVRARPAIAPHVQRMVDPPRLQLPSRKVALAHVYHSAAPWISRPMGSEMTRVAFGADAEFMRRTQDDQTLQRVMQILQTARTPRDLFGNLERRAVAVPATPNVAMVASGNASTALCV
jgi:hypothetical protein